jgi:hypothetical protein
MKTWEVLQLPCLIVISILKYLNRISSQLPFNSHRLFLLNVASLPPYQVLRNSLYRRQIWGNVRITLEYQFPTIVDLILCCSTPIVFIKSQGILSLRMKTAVFARVLQNVLCSTRLLPESRSYKKTRSMWLFSQTLLYKLILLAFYTS